VVSGGFGSAVGEVLAPMGIPVTAIAVPDTFIEQGSQAELHSQLGLDPSGVAARIRSALADSETAAEKVTRQGS
jgi:1-deoxy-D-xylulose-5-phosphate synthase